MLAAAAALLTLLSLLLFRACWRKADGSMEAMEGEAKGAKAQAKAMRKALAGLHEGLLSLDGALVASGRDGSMKRALDSIAAMPQGQGQADAAEAAATAGRILCELAEELTAAGSGQGKEAAIAFEDARMVLPLARKVVSVVPAKTEEATMSLIERFEEVRELSARAAEASKAAISHIEGGENSLSFQARARGTKAAIEAQKAAVSSIVDNNRDNARKLQAMSRELESGMELIAGIEEITERSRLIAFNMAVEAARIGERGRGFRVIVNELRSLNDRTVDFSRQVADLLGRYRDYSATLVAGMAEHSERLSGEVLDVMANAEGAVDSLIESSSMTEGLSARLARLVTDVDRDLDGVLEALQFQDVTRQMLEGAIGLIEDAEARLALAAPLLDGAGQLDRTEARRRFETMRAAFVARAKTKDEKSALLEVQP